MHKNKSLKKEIIKEAIARLDNNDKKTALALLVYAKEEDEEKKDFDYYLNPPDGKPFIGKRIDIETGKEIWCLLKRNTKYKDGPNKGKTQCAKKFDHKPTVDEIVDALQTIQFFMNK